MFAVGKKSSATLALRRAQIVSPINRNAPSLMSRDLGQPLVGGTETCAYQANGYWLKELLGLPTIAATSTILQNDLVKWNQF